MSVDCRSHDPVGPLARATLRLRDEAATDAIARRLADALSGGRRLYLSGDLGAGKTRLVRGLLRGLGHTGRVRSPTFTLLETYSFSKYSLYHFDFYRFSGENEWQEAGFAEPLSDASAVCIVEWPEMAGSQLPAPDLWLRLAPPPGETNAEEPVSERILEIEACSDWGQAWLTSLRTPDVRLESDGVSWLQV